MPLYQYMNTIRLSATAARNNFFQLLDKVAAGMEVVIEKDKKEIATLSPRNTKTDWVALRKASDAAWGIWKDEPYDPLDNPLRRPAAKKFLGRVDKAFRTKRKHEIGS